MHEGRRDWCEKLFGSNYTNEASIHTNIHGMDSF